MSNAKILNHHEAQLLNFNALWPKVDKIVEYYSSSSNSGKFVDDSWSQWSMEITSIYKDKDLFLRFSENPIIIKTMTGEHVRDRSSDLVRLIDPVFNPFIIEDTIGNNIIINKRLLTSAPRIGHLYVASLIKKICDEFKISLSNVTEIGGGFGGLMSLFVRSGYTRKFKIYDLPEILPLQYIYINTVCQSFENRTSFPLSCFESIGNINKTSSQNSVFISNWALTEASEELQRNALDSNFFGSSYAFICCEDNNANHKASTFLHDFLISNSTRTIRLQSGLNNSKLYFLDLKSNGIRI